MSTDGYSVSENIHVVHAFIGYPGYPWIIRKPWESSMDIHGSSMHRSAHNVSSQLERECFYMKGTKIY